MLKRNSSGLFNRIDLSELAKKEKNILFLNIKA
jgi:hypothetical protein